MRVCASAHGISIPELPVHLGYSTLNSESMLMQDVNLSWAGRGKALVNTSARLSSDAQCSIMIELSLRRSCTNDIEYQYALTLNVTLDFL